MFRQIPDAIRKVCEFTWITFVLEVFTITPNVNQNNIPGIVTFTLELLSFHAKYILRTVASLGVIILNSNNRPEFIALFISSFISVKGLSHENMS